MSKQKNDNPAPAGYSRVSPYLMVESVEEEIDFLVGVFGAEIREVLKNPDESILHAEALIGDTVVMIGKTSKGNPPRESMNYVFTLDVDETYKKALELGATSVMEPANQFYGLREAGLRDPQNNEWWISQHIETLSTKEMQKRLDEIKKK